jgi:hypothetical protein
MSQCILFPVTGNVSPNESTAAAFPRGGDAFGWKRYLTGRETILTAADYDLGVELIPYDTSLTDSLTCTGNNRCECFSLSLPAATL